MKAIVQHQYGAPQDVLHLAEVEMPVAGAEDVLVSVRASSANPWDWHFIRGQPLLLRPAGLGGIRKPKFPVPGGDLAGTVERAGSAVTAFKPGDETSDAVKLSSCLGKFFSDCGERDGFAVTLAGCQAVVQAAEQAAEQVALGGGMPVAVVAATVVVGASAG